ncbi:MAG: amidohydrolase family protein [Succinivibrionaceae bacterium]|nr:amidohydrolase family protein [Succinivibrionaceae bacterium]
MSKLLLKGPLVVGPHRIIRTDLLVDGAYIEKIGEVSGSAGADQAIDCHGLIALPGAIDAHVHFRDPGMPAKGTIRSESRAALLGGITTFMDMPNTQPPTTTMARVMEKRETASRDSVGNYAFYLGAASDNLDDIRSADPCAIAGIKVYMGSTTGGLLVSDPGQLERVFSAAPCLIAAHCEDNATIEAAMRRELTGRRKEDVPFIAHEFIRNRDCCVRSSRLAISIAQSTGRRLHIMHVSTKEEVEMLRPLAHGDLATRTVTGEGCVPHLFFSDSCYQALGAELKCNPSVKAERDRRALSQAIREGVLSTIGTDHAPHELALKSGPYQDTASGCVSAQHSLPTMLELCRRGEFTLEDLARAMAQNVATRYGIGRRGTLEEGNFADIVLVDMARPRQVTVQDLASPCGHSPFLGHTFPASVQHVVVSGILKVRDGKLVDERPGKAVEFCRN